MPERPAPSNDFLAQYNDVLRRLRAVEREMRLNGDVFTPLLTYEDGSPLGDTRHLDFGANLRAVLTGDGYVTVEGSGGAGPFDAIVDGTLSASNPGADTPIFVGIGEALAYLDGLGLESVNVFVRNDHTNYSSSSDLEYDETANFNCPSAVHLFALRAGQGSRGQNNDQTGVSWNLNGFRPIASGAAFAPPDFYIHNFALVQTGVFTSVPFRALYLYDTDFRAGSLAVPSAALCTNFYASGSTCDFAGNGTLTVATDTATFVQCDIETSPNLSGAHVLVPAGTLLTMVGCRFIAGGSGTTTVTLPTHFMVDADPVRGRQSAGGGTSITWTVPAGATGEIKSLWTNNGGIVVATANFTNLRLIGNFGTITATGTHESLVINGHNAGSHWDIRGPAEVSADVEGAGRLTVRGEGVSGVIGGDALTGSNTLLTFVAADRCCFVVGADPTGSARPLYNFDASSDRNVIVAAGHENGWAAGTNSGTNNRILPETAPPSGGIAPADADFLVGTANGDLTNEIVVGTTPQGELSGTWGSPTVDAIHSGSAHTDFIAKAIVDAKGDIIAATAADTVVRVPVGTDGEVLTADSADPSGVSWQPAASGATEPSVTDWMGF